MSPPEIQGQPVLSYTRLVSSAATNTGSTSQDNESLVRLLPELANGETRVRQSDRAAQYPAKTAGNLHSNAGVGYAAFAI
jgi:hypothetical protein